MKQKMKGDKGGMGTTELVLLIAFAIMVATAFGSIIYKSITKKSEKLGKCIEGAGLNMTDDNCLDD